MKIGVSGAKKYEKSIMRASAIRGHARKLGWQFTGRSNLFCHIF